MIAQELEVLFPSLVESTPDKDENGELTGTVTKSVKYSIFVPILIKALQEVKQDFENEKTLTQQQATTIQNLETRIISLEARLTAAGL